MDNRMEAKVLETVDGVTSWLLALFMILLAGVITHASAIMTVGGIIIMLLRMYVDGVKAYRVWKDRNDHKRSN